MDGWMDGWMGGWEGVWLDELSMDGWIDIQREYIKLLISYLKC